MYTVSVPLVSDTLCRSDRKALAQKLKDAGVQRIFLSIGTYLIDPEKRSACMAAVQDQCAFFKAQGFEVGVWVWTITLPEENSFTKITTIYGEVLEGDMCPADPQFRAFAADYVRDLARCGVDIILFDDDYRVTRNSTDFACTCKYHLSLTEQALGRPVTREEIAKAMTGAANPVRSAFQQVKAESLHQFAREMRSALNEVSPQTRMGLCTATSGWDVDGFDAPTISRILAGDTKPLLRLIAAPYWVSYPLWNHRLQDVIEMSRLERSWCGDGIEILAEGDTYPRPRFTCPAAFLEGFDTAMRADGTVNGILKYMVDYASTADYEPGYLERHQRNRPLYAQLEQEFGKKKAAGIRVYETMHKLEHQTLPDKPDPRHNGHRYLFSYAARMLSANGIPTTYEGPGCAGICFGENARHLPEEALEKGLILDGAAALLLQELGVDTGITEHRGDFILPGRADHVLQVDEYFPDYEEYARISGRLMALTVKPGAQVLSWYLKGGEKTPGSYFYENEKGQRFFVLCFDGCFCKENLFRQYTRSRQIGDVIPLLNGKKLPAHCPGNPDLYLMCKEGADETAVGLWNFCVDSVLQPRVKLHRPFETIRFIGCTGQIDGDTVTLSELPPYGFCGFIVK